MEQRVHQIAEKLAELARRDQSFVVYGSNPPHGHHYRQEPRFDKTQIDMLESLCSVQLPDELACFLQKVHGGGAGPGHGLLVERDLETLPRRAMPFAFDRAVTNDLIRRRVEGEERFGSTLDMHDFCDFDTIHDDDDGDWPLGPGFLPLAHRGCGITDVLVLVGEQRGLVWWCDMTWAPFHNDRGQQFGFLDWYEDWLDRSLGEVDEYERKREQARPIQTWIKRKLFGPRTSSGGK